MANAGSFTSAPFLLCSFLLGLSPMAAAVLALLVDVIGGAAGSSCARADDRAFLAADQAARRAANGRADADALGGFLLTRFRVAMPPALRRVAADDKREQ